MKCDGSCSCKEEGLGHGPAASLPSHEEGCGGSETGSGPVDKSACDCRGRVCMAEGESFDLANAVNWGRLLVGGGRSWEPFWRHAAIGEVVLQSTSINLPQPVLTSLAGIGSRDEVIAVEAHPIYLGNSAQESLSVVGTPLGTHGLSFPGHATGYESDVESGCLTTGDPRSEALFYSPACTDVGCKGNRGGVCIWDEGLARCRCLVEGVSTPRKPPSLDDGPVGPPPPNPEPTCIPEALNAVILKTPGEVKGFNDLYAASLPDDWFKDWEGKQSDASRNAMNSTSWVSSPPPTPGQANQVSATTAREGYYFVMMWIVKARGTKQCLWHQVIVRDVLRVNGVEQPAGQEWTLPDGTKVKRRNEDWGTYTVGTNPVVADNHGLWGAPIGTEEHIEFHVEVTVPRDFEYRSAYKLCRAYEIKWNNNGGRGQLDVIVQPTEKGGCKPRKEK
jgi:hypothetical protein